MSRFNNISRRDMLKAAAATALGASSLPVLGRGTPVSAASRTSDKVQLKFSTAGSATDVPIFNGLASIFNKTQSNAQAQFPVSTRYLGKILTRSFWQRWQLGRRRM